MIQFILWIHFTFGFIALLAGPGAMLTSKGSRWHRRYGKCYFWSMTMVTITALIVAIVRQEMFLLMIAIFSFYFAFSGYRSLYLKTLTQRVKNIDWLGVLLILCSALGLLIYGIMLYKSNQNGLIALIFGLFGFSIAIGDIKRFCKPITDPKAWFFLHMQKMLGAYIATITAFSVVNLTFLPNLVCWLWPTVFGSIGIVNWIIFYKRRFSKVSK